MAPHQATEVDEHRHHGVPAKPLPLCVASKINAGKPAPYKRDLQSAMQNAPQVRVIHIFAPKVIKTDVANFRSTVQKLTGRSKRRTASAARVAKAPMTPPAAPSSVDGRLHISTTILGAQANNGPEDHALQGSSSMRYRVGLWEKEELQRLVSDACSVPGLVRSDSVDSGSYSLDSNNTVFSGDSSGIDASPTDQGFSFYPQREIPYSLSEIPAPFFGLHSHDIPAPFFAPCSSVPMPSLSGSLGLLPDQPNFLGSTLPTTTHVMDQTMSTTMGFDGDSVAAALPLPTLSDITPLGCSPISSSSTTSSGSLFDLPRHHCRLSVQQPYYGANFFESM